MESLSNILVLMEPEGEAQPAFDAAMVLAKRFGAKLDLFISDYQDLSAAYYAPLVASTQQFHDAIVAEHRATLERFVQMAAAGGVTATSEVAWGTPFHELAIDRVMSTKPGLVVKRSVYHNPIERTLFTGSDWHLIRECLAPLLLVKDAAALVDPKLLVCVDPTHSRDKPAALDHQLLRTAALFAERLGGEVHALHVFTLPRPVGVIGDAYIAAATVPVDDTANVEHAEKLLKELLAAHPMARDHAHLRVGTPARDIVDEARKLGIGILVMGAVSRGRLERWIVGNTAESVLDRVPCNVLIEKPVATGHA
jgi:universal stress protein E